MSGSWLSLVMAVRPRRTLARVLGEQPRVLPRAAQPGDERRRQAGRGVGRGAGLVAEARGGVTVREHAAGPVGIAYPRATLPFRQK
jgi:hypothetical protein